MSIETRIQAINDHLIDDYKVLRLAGADLTGVNKNIVNLKMSWKERLLYFMNNGTNEVWNNWDKVSGTGTTLSLNNTVEALMKLEYKGNTSQSGTPTPSSPVDIQVVSGDNTITVSNSDNTESTSYPISLGDIELCKIGTYQDKIDKSTGKNLYNGELELGSINPANGNLVSDNSRSRSINFVKVKPNTTYSISKNVNSIMWTVGYTSNKVGIVDGGNTPETSGQASALVALGASINSGTFTTTSTTEYIKAYFTTSNSLTTNIMLNEGSTALPYEPYGTNWYLKKEIGKVVLDGSESWQNTYGESLFGFELPYKKIDMSSLSYNNYYTLNNIQSGLNAGLSNGQYTIQINIAVSVLYIKNTNYTTTNDFKTWLSTHNTIAYYPLEIPTYETITDTTLLGQLEALKKSYEGQTNISQVNDGLPFELSVTALEVMS